MNDSQKVCGLPFDDVLETYRLEQSAETLRPVRERSQILIVTPSNLNQPDGFRCFGLLEKLKEFRVEIYLARYSISRQIRYAWLNNFSVVVGVGLKTAPEGTFLVRTYHGSQSYVSETSIVEQLKRFVEAEAEIRRQERAEDAARRAREEREADMPG